MFNKKSKIDNKTLKILILLSPRTKKNKFDSFFNLI
jgi:hypothetical protein